MGALLSLILPAEKDQKIKGRANTQGMIRKLMKRVDVTACPPSLLTGIRRERTARLIFGIGGGVFSLLFAAPAVFCLADPSRFVMEGETEPVVVALCFTVFGSALALCGWIAVSFLCAACLKRELALVKEAVKTAPLNGGSREIAPASNSATVMLWSVRGVVFVAAVVLIVLGINGGGVIDVFENAIKICTSCIGLG